VRSLEAGARLALGSSPVAIAMLPTAMTGAADGGSQPEADVQGTASGGPFPG
jgi:hypothetical protein